MEKVFFDSSACIALFVKKEEHHKKANHIYTKLREANITFISSDYILDETLTTILNRYSHQQSLIAGTAFLNSQLIQMVPIAPDYLKKSWELYKKYDDKKFSFTDVTSFTLMKEFEITKAFTFDEDFKKAGFEVLA